MSADQWYYVQAGQQAGPVTWEQLRAMVQAGTIGRAQLVWAEGMPDWVMAGTVAGLFGATPPPPPVMPSAPAMIPIAYATAIYDDSPRILHNARVNCVAMFALLIATLLPRLIGMLMPAHGRLSSLGRLFMVDWAVFLGFLVFGGAIFAAIYLPLRWKYIRQLTPPYQIVGLIGGVGLLSLAAVMIIYAMVRLFS